MYFLQFVLTADPDFKILTFEEKEKAMFNTPTRGVTVTNYAKRFQIKLESEPPTN